MMFHAQWEYSLREKREFPLTLADTVALPLAAVLTYPKGELWNWEVSFDIHLELLAPTCNHLRPAWTCSSLTRWKSAGSHNGSHWGSALYRIFQLRLNTSLKCFMSNGNGAVIGYCGHSFCLYCLWIDPHGKRSCVDKLLMLLLLC